MSRHRYLSNALVSRLSFDSMSVWLLVYPLSSLFIIFFAFSVLSVVFVVVVTIVAVAAFIVLVVATVLLLVLSVSCLLDCRSGRAVCRWFLLYYFMSCHVHIAFVFVFITLTAFSRQLCTKSFQSFYCVSEHRT